MDNAFISGSQETLLLAKQIIDNEAASRAMLLDLVAETPLRKALQQEWKKKDQAMEDIVAALRQVQALVKREHEILLGK